MSSRLDAFRAMVAKNPANATAHFGLANEAQKEGLLEEALAHYQAYLAASDDEGAAYGRVAEILIALGRPAGAREQLERGIAAARRFGHPGMASEFEMQLEEL
jgi:tetratricopeptide (TPR) repeat protein